MIDVLNTKLSAILLECSEKIKPENIKEGVIIFGTTGTLQANCKTFATIEEMNQHIDLPEDTFAIVYGTTYIGTYRLDSGTWTQIGDSTQEQQIMDVLNLVDVTNDQYEGNGGTDEEINQVLDNILEGGNV